jgi:hypothetical protein
LANARVNRAMKDIQLIGNLSNRSNYQYTERDVDLIFRALNDEIKNCRSKFAADGGAKADKFTLE